MAFRWVHESDNGQNSIDAKFTHEIQPKMDRTPIVIVRETVLLC